MASPMASSRKQDLTGDDDVARANKRLKAGAAVIDLVVSDEDAWLLTGARRNMFVPVVREMLMTKWREDNILPHCGPENKAWAYREDKVTSFDHMLETQYLGDILNLTRKKENGHKRLEDVDFASLYSETVQIQQCKEDLLMMARSTPGDFWPITPRGAFLLMLAAEHLEEWISSDDFVHHYDYALRGEAREVWKSQGSHSGRDDHRDPFRERGFYWGLRDCFTKIAQRLATGRKPHPQTHAELWACCLLFDSEGVSTCTMFDSDEELTARYESLPKHSCDDDFCMLEITRYALLGPVFGSAKPPPPKPPRAGPPKPRREVPTAETREARAAAYFASDAFLPKDLKIGNKEMLAQMCMMRATAEEYAGESDDEGPTYREPQYVHNLPEKPVSAWFDPLPANCLNATPSSAAPASERPWDSQLSSAGWRAWPVVDAGEYGLVCGGREQVRVLRR